MSRHEPPTGRQPDTPTAERVAEDIPVTVVGGYLGSGKTTLVNHLLTTATERIAVLVNDFGEVDIDAALIEQADGDTIALANGCICCSLVDGLAAALDTVSNLEPAPDRLVIEASGVADPASVAAYGHSPGFVLDAVVVLVDTETVRQRAADRYVGDTVLGQLRSADVAVLNKIDLVEPHTVAEVGEWLRGQVDRAVVVEVSQSKVDPAVLFGRLATPGRDDREVVGRAPAAAEVFQTWTWAAEAPVSRMTLETVMAELPEDVVRAKGVVWLDDDHERPHVLQRVGGRWSLRPARPNSGALQATGSRLVVIGARRAIDDDWLSTRLSSTAR